MLSGIWFGPKTFYPVWLKAKGITDQLSNKNPIVLFGSTFLATLGQTFVLVLLINSLQVGHANFSVLKGAGIGLLMGVGIAALNSLPHRLFSGENFKSWAVECGCDVLNYSIVGAIVIAMH